MMVGMDEADNEEVWSVEAITDTKVELGVRKWMVTWSSAPGTDLYDPTWEERDCFVGDDGTTTAQFIEFEKKRAAATAVAAATTVKTQFEDVDEDEDEDEDEDGSAMSEEADDDDEDDEDDTSAGDAAAATHATTTPSKRKYADDEDDNIDDALPAPALLPAGGAEAATDDDDVEDVHDHDRFFSGAKAGQCKSKCLACKKVRKQVRKQASTHATTPAAAAAASAASAAAAAAAVAATKSKSASRSVDDVSDEDANYFMPLPGYVCARSKFYSTLNNETVLMVADKLGCAWRDLADVNQRYGVHKKPVKKLKKAARSEMFLKAKDRFKENTLLSLPKVFSKWRVKKMFEADANEEVCTECGKDCDNHPTLGAASQLLLCDGCENGMHLDCMNPPLDSVPEGDWFCVECCKILSARKEALLSRSPSVKARLPWIGSLSKAELKLGATFRETLNAMLLKRQEAELAAVDQERQTLRRDAEAFKAMKRETPEVLAKMAGVQEQVLRGMPGNSKLMPLPRWSYGTRLPLVWERGVDGSLAEIDTTGCSDRQFKNDTLRGFGGSNHPVLLPTGERPEWAGFWGGSGHCERRGDRTRWRFFKEVVEKLEQISGWHDLVSRSLALKTGIEESQQLNYWKVKGYGYEVYRVEAPAAEGQLQENEIEVQNRYAGLRGVALPQHDWWKLRAWSTTRESPPKIMGRLVPTSQADCHLLYKLETDHVLFVPETETGVSKPDEWKLQPGRAFIIFGREWLFSADNDDETPLTGTGIRDAVRLMMALLGPVKAGGTSMVVKAAATPTSVRTRDEAAPPRAAFDLAELVRDCNVPLDLPQEPTPAQMAANGLALRDYQQASLQFMIDKELAGGDGGMGVNGELWSRMRFLDAGCSSYHDPDSKNCTYFYCELTGSIRDNIFDHTDGELHEACISNCGAYPSGSILGEEMGLGKTMICLALIVRNLPPLKWRILPREHELLSEKARKKLCPSAKVAHPLWTHPVVAAQKRETSAAASSNLLVSNGTLVLAPATLISQWSSEIEKYAPWLRVITLHSSEKPSHVEVATSDVVIMSTFFLQHSGNGNTTLSFVRRTHWHRLIVDESHYNQSSDNNATQRELSKMMATNRHCVTGTPIGHSLDDLYGQLRFLRVAPFNRLAFWKDAVSDGYYNGSTEALRILRSLLSRVVVRHSKEQRTRAGDELVALPPRTVETLLIPFGSEAEREVYAEIERRNRERFIELYQESPATVASHYIRLLGMLVCARQCCSHLSMIDLVKMDRTNRALGATHPAGLDKGKQRAAGGGIAAAAAAGSKEAPTRAVVLKSAVERGRKSAEARIRICIAQIQSGEEIECPICLEVSGEQEVTLPPCGHPCCTECISNLLTAATTTREARGNCAICRDVFLKSELTKLEVPLSEVAAARAAAAITAATAAGTGGRASVHSGAGVAAADAAFTTVGRSSGGSVTKESAAAVVGSRAAPVTNMYSEIDAANLYTLSKRFLKYFEEGRALMGTKVTRLMVEVQQMVENDPTSKCVVFSQFVGVLDVAAQEFAANGVKFVRVDGSVKQHERADALLNFQAVPDIRVFLLSMRAGAVGLTLTAADHCFILDTPTNPATEEQAIDRIHRIGQLRPVTVKRFVLADTVEERILRVRRKLGVDAAAAAAAAGGAGGAGGGGRVGDGSAPTTLLAAEMGMQDPEKVVAGADAESPSRSRSAGGGGGGAAARGSGAHERRQDRIAKLAAMFGVDQELKIAT